jgi:hypothetical protein
MISNNKGEQIVSHTENPSIFNNKLEARSNFNKIEERCRSASKARHAHVKKNECMDKNQKAHNGETNKEVRFNKKLKLNKNKDSCDFKEKEKDCYDKKSKSLKDSKEFKKCNDKERELCLKDEKEKCSDNSKKKSLNKEDKYDLLNKLAKKNEYCKDQYIDDDKYCLKKDYSRSRSRDYKKDYIDKYDHGDCSDIC